MTVVRELVQQLAGELSKSKEPFVAEKLFSGLLLDSGSSLTPTDRRHTAQHGLATADAAAVGAAAGGGAAAGAAAAGAGAGAAGVGTAGVGGSASVEQANQGGESFVKWAEEMSFLPQHSFTGGLNKRLKELLGLQDKESVQFERSIRQEFEQNDRGKWLSHLQYVLSDIQKEEYPSTKGTAPTEQMCDAYTRDLRHCVFKNGDLVTIKDGRVTHVTTERVVQMIYRQDKERLRTARRIKFKLQLPNPLIDERVGAIIELMANDADGTERVFARFPNPGMSLADFRRRQPGFGTDNELTLAEIAVLRLYTGPVFQPWNAWLRGLDSKRARTKPRTSRVVEWRDVDDAHLQPPPSPSSPTSAKLQHAKTTPPGDILRTISSMGSTGESNAGGRCEWRTSIAVLYQALIKLSVYTEPATVFRGVREVEWRLPDYFTPGAADRNPSPNPEPQPQPQPDTEPEPEPEPQPDPSPNPNLPRPHCRTTLRQVRSPTPTASPAVWSA